MTILEFRKAFISKLVLVLSCISTLLVVRCGEKVIHYKHVNAGFGFDVPTGWNKVKEDDIAVEFQSPEGIILRAAGSEWERKSFDKEFITDHTASNLVREICIQAKDVCCGEAKIMKYDIIEVGTRDWSVMPCFGIRLKGFSETMEKNAVVSTVGAVSQEFKYQYTMCVLCDEDTYVKQKGSIDKMIESYWIEAPADFGVVKKELNEYGDTIPIIGSLYADLLPGYGGSDR